ncbi:MAG: hypothetical protein R2847_08295 [Bacteroidia bacterium]
MALIIVLVPMGFTNDFGGIDILSAIAPQDEHIVGAGSFTIGGVSNFLTLRMDTLGTLDWLYNGSGFTLHHFRVIQGCQQLQYNHPINIW